ncbi:MAG: hypothetical protein V1895_02135 [Parcubacteria group bacterium]
MGLFDFFRTPVRPLSQQEFAEMKRLEFEIPHLKDLKKRREKLLEQSPGKFLPKSERPWEIEYMLKGRGSDIGIEKRYWKYRNRYKNAGVEGPGQQQAA